jgi:CubicO group peptidase (beta-lactamase class C family)
MRTIGALLLALALPCAATLAPDDADSVGAFFDGAIGAEAAAGNVVGATLAVVANGRVVTTRGYGVADRDTGALVRADATLFRIGSVSKVLVWIAVLQQVDAGTLDLDRDVNEYLRDFEIPPTVPAPVTLRHLMTHTPGFEDRVIGLFARGVRTVGDPHENLLRMRPLRVAMPGADAAYSNWGAALAAHLVEIASGMPFDDYVERRILVPLAMTRTTTRQPVPEAFAESASRGYRKEQGAFVDVPFEFVSLPAAGSVSSTANDMAQLMLALLGRGAVDVLSPASRTRLFERAFAPDPRANGVTLGLYEMTEGGVRAVGHGGDTLAFHSAMRLYPENGVGIFVSFNADTGARARDHVLAAFDRQVFGGTAPVVQPDRPPSVARYLGAYRMLRVPAQGPSRLLALLSSVVVRADAEGRLLLPDGEGGVAAWVAMGEGRFAAPDGRARVTFAGPADAPASRLYFDAMPVVGFERAPARDHPFLQLGTLGVALVVLAFVVVWPFSSFARRHRAPVHGEAGATLLGFAVAVVLLVLTAALGALVENAADVVFGMSPAFERLLWVPIGILPFLALMLVATSRAWVRGYWWPARRVHYTLVAFAAWVLVAWYYYWHLVAVPMPVWR